VPCAFTPQFPVAVAVSPVVNANPVADPVGALPAKTYEDLFAIESL
jgi:hypothetical protein